MAQKLNIDLLSGKPLLTNRESVNQIQYSNGLQSLLQSKSIGFSAENFSTTEIRGYYISPEKEVNFSAISINIITGSPGSSIVGIYEIDNTGYPTNLILEVGPYDNNITSLQSVLVSEKLEAGNYFIGYSSNSAATCRSINVSDLRNTCTLGGLTSGTSPKSGLRIPFLYTGSMPNPMPLGAVSITADVPYMLFTV